MWFFGRWSAGPGLRIIPLPESVDVGLRLPKEGGPTAYANSVSAVSIITVVTVDDVLFPFDKGEPAAAAGWWCGDVHVLVDSALPHSADLEANRGAVLRGDRRCLGIIGVLDRDCSPRENCRKLLQLFGRSPRLRTLTRVDLPGVPKERPGGLQTTAEIANAINVEVHAHADLAPSEWAAALNIRSAYRNESDFRLQAIEAVQSSQQSRRFPRIIDADESVSDNYKRLTWKRQADIDKDAEEDMTVGQYRREFLSDLQAAMRTLFTDPSLTLQDFGGVQDAGTFRFAKGTAIDFHYKNLSGGEKAAFDLLLDIFVKRGEYKPTFPIWLNIPLSKSSAFFKPLSICETLAVGMAIITP